MNYDVDVFFKETGEEKHYRVNIGVKEKRPFRIRSIIDLINFWTKLNLNILTNQNIYKIILNLSSILLKKSIQ